MSRKQRRPIVAHLKENAHTHLSIDAVKKHRLDFDRVRQRETEEWERQVEQEWPKYAKDILEKKARS